MALQSQLHENLGMWKSGEQLLGRSGGHVKWYTLCRVGGCLKADVLLLGGWTSILEHVIPKNGEIISSVGPSTQYRDIISRWEGLNAAMFNIGDSAGDVGPHIM